jgi:hypothetical protein
MLGSDGAQPYTCWWVSPVHVAIGREGVSILPPDALQLSAEEAAGFNAVMQTQAAQAGWTPMASAMAVAPQFGCLMQSATPLPQALPSPWALARQRFTDLLPGGAQMSDWRRLWMDLQMALHDHPLNQDREARGLPVVNAYWWWGGGRNWPVAGDVRIRLLLSDLADGALDGQPVLSDSLHRCAVWLAPRLCSADSHAATHSEKAPPEDVPDTHAIHLIENTSAHIWFASGARHPAVQRLDAQLMAALAMAGASHQLVLTGQSAWRSVSSSMALRLQIWKTRANPSDLLEPIAGLLDEAALARAWQESAQRSTPDGGEFHPDRF